MAIDKVDSTKPNLFDSFKLNHQLLVSRSSLVDWGVKFFFGFQLGVLKARGKINALVLFQLAKPKILPATKATWLHSTRISVAAVATFPLRAIWPNRMELVGYLVFKIGTFPINSLKVGMF